MTCDEFSECATCAAKPGSPTLCSACLHNRATINRLRAENEVLTSVYVSAARLRTFPVPFDDHFALVGAVDECRSVLEPPVDDFAPEPTEESAGHGVRRAQATRPLVGISVLVVKDDKLLLGRRKGSHGAGEYAAPGGHLEHLESFQACAAREVLEETGVEIGMLQFLRVLNTTDYAPKHYVDVAFVAQWQAGEPTVREPDKVESWSWYDLNDIPSPLFSMLPSAIAMMIDARPLQVCQDLPRPRASS